MDAERWRRIEAIVDEAFSQQGAERAACLDRACDGDADLRRDVESLLAGQGASSGVLRSLGLVPGAEPLTPGTRLGPYEITGPIGAGGMGEVYKARDTRLGRTVAIKVLPPDLASDPERRRRFEHEARAIAALNHPHICTLHDIGEAVLPDPGSRIPGPVRVSYLVMEYVEGQTLAERLKQGQLPLAQALEAGAQIADALSAAHARGIVHRDLKPANVMWAASTAPGTSGVRATLLDFGLARLHAPRPEIDASSFLSTETAPGMLLGTFPYMAPEQVRGLEVDARSDIWALGAVLYEMLAGSRAFPGSDVAGLCAAILEREPVPLTASRGDLPPGLPRLVAKCLAKDPARRPQTISEVRDALEALRDQSVRRSPGRTRAVRRGWPATARGRVSMLAALGASIILLGLWWYADAWRRTPIPVEAYDRYVYGRERCAEYQQLTIADGIAALQEVIERYPSFAPAHAQLGHCLTLKANLSAEQAVPLLALAKREVADALRLDAGLGLAHAAAAMVKLMLDHDWAGAGASSLRAIETDPYNAVCRNARGAYQLAVGDYDDAVASFQQAERLNPRSPFDQVNHGFSLIIAGRPEEAVAQHRRTIQHYPDFVFARMELAWALLEAGRPEEAMAAHDEARRLLPSGTSTGVDCWLNRVDFVAGDPGRARKLVADWTARAERVFVDPYDLARLRAGIDDIDGAVPLLERAYAENSVNLWLLNAWFRVWPQLFADPRVQDIRRRLKLPEPTPGKTRPTVGSQD